MLGLALVHFVVFSRSLVARPDGALHAHIPFDFEDSYHRFLIYISDCLAADTLPLWYPYGSAGTPFFINPQNQLWSPITWLVAGIFGYTHHVAQRQLVWTVLAAGLGAYFLTHAIVRARTPAFFAGLCYMLTGAIVSNIEHLDIVNAWAYAPFLFLALLATAQNPWRFAPALALVTTLLLTSGYPGVVIMLVPWAAVATVLAIFRLESRRARINFGLATAIAVALGGLMAAGHLVPIATHLGAFTRGDALDLATALAGSLSPAYFLGLIFPFTVDSPWAGFTPDPSMRGFYLGIVSVPIIALALANRRDKWSGPVAVAAFIALLMSTGAFFFPRITLHVLFPVFNFSRFPAADSRGLAALALSILVGLGARAALSEPEESRNLLGRWFVRLAIAAAVALVPLRLVLLADKPLPAFNDNVVGPIMLQIAFLLAAAVAVRRVNDTKTALVLVAGVLALDLGSGVLSGHEMVGQALTPEEYKKRAELHSTQFNPAAAKVPRLATGKNLFDTAATAGYLSKTFYLSDYSAVRLKSFDGLLARGFQDWLTNGPRAVALPTGAKVDQFSAFGAQAQPVQFEITSYLADSVDYTVKVDKPSLLVFNEIYFPGWKATIDGAKTDMIEVAGGLRGLEVQPGNHQIHTYFRPRAFYVGLTGTVIGWLVLIGWALAAYVSARRARGENRTTAAGAPSAGV